MRTIIAGSRGITSFGTVEAAFFDALTHGINPTIILSGTARGVDQLGERFAAEFDLPVERYPAEWDRYGKSAGYRRNELMATKADALIAIWDGESRGTKHMIDLAHKHGLKVHVHRIRIERGGA